METENIFGNDDFSGFKESEITDKITRNILLAGKIGKQKGVIKMEQTSYGFSKIVKLGYEETIEKRDRRASCM